MEERREKATEGGGGSPPTPIPKDVAEVEATATPLPNTDTHANK